MFIFSTIVEINQWLFRPCLAITDIF